ncbi:type 1 glutamine amidotransferase domain-containing protein [Thalassotalea sp. LPB0316]|uniref:type 1 glutamine amidotransferase domain-containing protein n=1 Tax=Thalassotalea sp. LPB0316 TaxID=2769490 RepID=UPI00186719F5|nr:type 1 glutamine amidotransferase domain-containing protein [Thalassotalea sp. LPB0316]QOL25611.1 type 1 glutamine amidotransferase domain-containing protein [Thalassotalea sp. LPB0316]
MKPILTLIFFTLLVLAVPVRASSAAETKVITKNQKVAMLISGYGSVDPELSYDLEELVQSYLIFHRNGVSIDIVSPSGGKVLVKNNKDDLPAIKFFKQQTSGLSQLQNTLSATQASANQYDALFIVGGDGAVMDLPFDTNTKQWITRFAQSNMPIAAVCHGPAALIDIKLADGRYYVAGKRVNSFTLIEDKAFKKENIEKYKVIAQTELENRGAHFIANSPMLPFITRDGNLITAQNPMSVAKAAEALLVQMGITPAKRELFKDEATMELIAKAKSMGMSHIDLALTQQPEAYDMMYLALYGLYAYDLAQTDVDKAKELTLMEKIGEYFKHPKYAEHMITTYVKTRDLDRARYYYNKAKNDFPDFTLPESLIATLAP